MKQQKNPKQDISKTIAAYNNSVMSQAQKELSQLFLAYNKSLIKEEEIAQRIEKKIWEANQKKEQLLAKMGRSSAEIKEEMRACFAKYRTQLEEETGDTFKEIACDYGKVGMKENKASVVLEGEEADILNQLKKHGFEQFIVSKERVDKQLVLRIQTDELMVKALKKVGISTICKEEFFVKAK